MLIFLSFMKMDTPSKNSISWGGIIFVALARNVLVVLRFRSAITSRSRIFSAISKIMLRILSDPLPMVIWTELMCTQKLKIGTMNLHIHFNQTNIYFLVISRRFPIQILAASQVYIAVRYNGLAVCKICFVDISSKYL